MAMLKEMRRPASVFVVAVILVAALDRSSPDDFYAQVRAPSHSWKAGVARIVITPSHSLWMAGYASRARPSQGKLQDLYAKALALEDEHGKRVVIVTTDLIGLSHSIAEPVATRAHQIFGLPRSHLLLTSSHTHCGPALHGSLEGMMSGAKLSAGQKAGIDEYSRQLEDKLVAVIDEALKELSPAHLSFSRSEAMFGVNRRERGPNGVQFGSDKNGVVDHDVPVLRVDSPQGRVRAILFGYACHNTALPGEFYKFAGDYAGFAQAALEKAHPGATALFIMGCGGDINPQPNGTPELALQHGQSLAASVDRAMSSSPVPVRGPLRIAFDRFMLPLAAAPTEKELRKQLSDPDRFRRGHARRLLARLKRDGRLPSELKYTAQVFQFGSELTMVALAGEVVSDYALRLKRELGSNGLWVASYSNDVFGYVPSARVLKEGGYEADGSVVFYDLPAPFAPAVEEKIITKVHEMVRECGRRPLAGR